MASYELVFKQSITKDLRKLPKRDVTRVMQRIRALADEPRPSGSEKLTSSERYRIRQGKYRILYEIQDEKFRVLIVKVAGRGQVYRDKS